MTGLGIVLIVIGVFLLLAVSLISSALGTIMLAALYIYAAEGEIPGEFDSGIIRQAFATK